MPRLNFLSPHESAIAPHFLALPDYESDRTSYELTVRASDGGLHADVTVTVNVTDVEEQSVVEDTVPEPLPSVSEPYYTGGDFSEDVSTTGRVAGSGGHMHADDSHGRSLGTYTLSVEEVVDAI